MAREEIRVEHFCLEKDVQEQVRDLWLVLDRAASDQEALFTSCEALIDPWHGTEVADKALMIMAKVLDAVEALQDLRHAPGGDLHEG